MIRLAALLILLALPASAQDNPIVARMTELATAYNAGDAAAIAQIYTQESAVLPPGQTAVIGRGAIGLHYKQAFLIGAKNLRFNSLEIRQYGPDTAVEIGATRVEVGGKDIGGRYMHVWRREGGQWFLHRDIYHVMPLGN